MNDANVIDKEEVEFKLPPDQELERAVSDYLNVSRNKNNPNMFREYNYWPAEEKAWERLIRALEDDH